MFEEKDEARSVLGLGSKIRLLQRRLDERESELTTLRAEIETLKRAQRAVVTLDTLQGQELKRLREKSRDEWVATETLDSERDANAMLTAELDFTYEKLTTLRAQNAALQAVAIAAQIAAEELEYFVDFAVRQCEFEGDEVAGYAAVNAVRNALAEVAK